MDTNADSVMTAIALPVLSDRQAKNQNLVPLDGCACVSEESVYGGQKVPKSHDMEQLRIKI